MKTNSNPNRAKVVYQSAGIIQRHVINYNTVDDLLQRVFDFEVSQGYVIAIFLITDISNGLRLTWNSVYAHYCFAKGRITERDFYDLLKAEGYQSNETHKFASRKWHTPLPKTTNQKLLTSNK
jgi:hypothetical protein